MPLTDQKFNGPLAPTASDARNRIQLVKPQQVMNNGSSQPSASSSTSSSAPRINGEMPKGQTKSETLDADSQNYLNSLKNRQSAFKALSDLPDTDRDEVIAYFTQKPQNSTAKGMAGAVPQYDQRGVTPSTQQQSVTDYLNANNGHASKFDDDFNGYDTYNLLYTMKDSADYANQYYKNKFGGDQSSTDNGMDAPSRAQLILQNIQNKIQNRGR